MRKSNCLFSKLKSRILLALAVFALAFAVAGCDSPAGTGGTKQIPLVAAVEGVPDEFLGRWSDDNYAPSQFEIEKSVITDVLTPCVYNVVSSQTVNGADGYTFIYCQCAQGTDYTPTGYYYVVALKKDGNKTHISCPLDFNNRITSLSELQSAYTENSTIAMNYAPICSKVVANNNVTVMSAMVQCSFTENSTIISMQKVDGWDVYDSFTPTRDKNKEKGNIALYLYNPSERQIYGADLNYCAVKNEGGTYYVYWYLYDENEDENYSILEDMYEGMLSDNDMPIVSADNLEKLKQMYQ